MNTIAPIHVRRYGSTGSPVVVLHGGPGAHGSAMGVARELAPEFSVWEPLQRRSGLLPLTVTRHVEDLAEVAPPRGAVVGHSWGAMLGLSFAARYPERVSSVVLVGCGTYGEDSRNEFRRRLSELMDEGTRSRITALKERLQAEPETHARDAILKELGAAYMRIESYDPIEEAEEAMTPDALGNTETWQDAQRRQREGIEPQNFAAISCPVLMLHGAIDPHPGEMTRDVLQRFIPHIEYVEFEKCGHEPWKERQARDAFFSTLRKWLRSRTL